MNIWYVAFGFIGRLRSDERRLIGKFSFMDAQTSFRKVNREYD